jgi:hypothetical protein
MSASRKFDEETRARAVRLYQDRLGDHGESKLATRFSEAGEQQTTAPASNRSSAITRARQRRRQGAPALQGFRSPIR